MSFLDKMKSLWGGSARAIGPSRRVHIVDAGALMNGQRDRRSPLDLLNMLQRLGKFVQREKIELCAVLEGRPLREADEGSEFNGVRVFYADNAEQRADKILRLLDRYARKGVVVVTGDRKLESSVQARGGLTLRASTWRKALEDSGGPKQQDARRSPRGRRRGRRGPRNEGQSNQSPPKQQEPRSKPDQGVSDLIDLV